MRFIITQGPVWISSQLVQTHLLQSATVIRREDVESRGDTIRHIKFGAKTHTKQVLSNETGTRVKKHTRSRQATQQRHTCSTQALSSTTSNSDSSQEHNVDGSATLRHRHTAASLFLVVACTLRKTPPSTHPDTTHTRPYTSLSRLVVSLQPHRC